MGVELCVAALVNPIFDRLPGDGAVAGRADGARVMGRLMPWWYAVSLVLTVSLAATTQSALAAAGAALLALSVVMSVTVLVPINNLTRTWTPESAPSDWRMRVRRWDRWHYVRVAVIAAGFISLAISTVASMASM